MYPSHVLFLKGRFKNFDKYYLLAGAIKHMNIYPSHVYCLIILNIFIISSDIMLFDEPNKKRLNSNS